MSCLRYIYKEERGFLSAIFFSGILSSGTFRIDSEKLYIYIISSLSGYIVIAQCYTYTQYNAERK